jgi:hypothetical protein
VNQHIGGRRTELAELHEAHHKTAAAVGDLTKLLDELAPKVLGVRTFVLDGNGQATDNVRIPYRALAVSHIGAVATNTKTITGSVTSPAAGATIAQVALPAGIYTVSWEVELSGAIAAAELNNFQLFQSGTGAPGGVLTAINAAAAGLYPQLPVTITSTNADNFIKIIAPGLGTAGAVYNAQMTVTQVANPAPLYVINQPPMQNNPTSGPGVAALRSGGMTAVNLRGYSYTIAGGSAGDLVTVTAFASNVPPVSS